jgi:membrane dipeptidase
MNKRHLIVDGHLDLSMNAMEWNRDLRWDITEIRLSEKELNDKPDRGKGTVNFQSMRDGNVFLCMATLIGRYVKKGNKLPGWNSPEQAWAQTQGQLAWYRTMEDAGEMVQIRNNADLENQIKLWEKGTGKLPVGYILTLEGADSIISMKHLEKAFENGLRAVGPAHFGPGTYAFGTAHTGGLGEKGRALLREMEMLDLILDATHLSDESFREALDIYHGPVWASHNNCRVFVDHPRQFTDEQVKELVSRDGVIGAALDAWMLVPDWERGEHDPKKRNVSLELVVNNIDHVCQIAGNSLHAAIGSDLDGAFGTEQSPKEIDTIADLQKIPGLLHERGYEDSDIKNILSGNWLRFLRKNLPS